MFDNPEVGPFFVINNEVYGMGEEIINMVPNELDVYDSSLTHLDYFNELVENLEELHLNKYSDYGEFPRGRVICFKDYNKFVIYADKCIINNENIKKRVVDEFSLTNQMVEWQHDEHYTCANCDKEIKENIELINKVYRIKK